MDLDNWIMTNIDHLTLTTKNIVKNDEEADDVFQSVIEQLLSKREQLSPLDDKEKLYFFIRVVKNNYHSTTSRYYKEHKKGYDRNISLENIQLELFDEEYIEELPDISWIKRELNKLSWFERDLFLMWFELGSLINVSKTTTIPVNSVGRYIRQIKDKLRQKWENRN